LGVSFSAARRMLKDLWLLPQKCVKQLSQKTALRKNRQRLNGSKDCSQNPVHNPSFFTARSGAFLGIDAANYFSFLTLTFPF
jgi:hypothetical protein